MPIELIDEPGSAVYRTKLNEIINAYNALVASLTVGNNTLHTWINFAPGGTPAIYGQGGNIASLTDIGSGVRLTFATPFPSADSYGAVCTSTAIPGKTTGISQLRAQSSDYVEFGWVVDDGATGYPTRATILVMWNVEP